MLVTEGSPVFHFGVLGRRRFICCATIVFIIVLARELVVADETSCTRATLRDQLRRTFNVLKLGHAWDIKSCINLCCAKKVCDLALFRRGRCYGIRCSRHDLCRSVVNELRSTQHEISKRSVSGIEDFSSEFSHSSRSHGFCRQRRVIPHHVFIQGGRGVSNYRRLSNDVMSMRKCNKRCCEEKDCSLAFLMRRKCYGVICPDDGDCHSKNDMRVPLNLEVALIHRRGHPGETNMHKAIPTKKSRIHHHKRKPKLKHNQGHKARHFKTQFRKHTSKNRHTIPSLTGRHHKSRNRHLVKNNSNRLQGKYFHHKTSKHKKPKRIHHKQRKKEKFKNEKRHKIPDGDDIKEVKSENEKEINHQDEEGDGDDDDEKMGTDSEGNMKEDNELQDGRKKRKRFHHKTLDNEEHEDENNVDDDLGNEMKHRKLKTDEESKDRSNDQIQKRRRFHHRTLHNQEHEDEDNVDEDYKDKTKHDQIKADEEDKLEDEDEDRSHNQSRKRKRLHHRRVQAKEADKNQEKDDLENNIKKGDIGYLENRRREHKRKNSPGQNIEHHRKLYKKAKMMNPDDQEDDEKEHDVEDNSSGKKTTIKSTFKISQNLKKGKSEDNEDSQKDLRTKKTDLKDESSNETDDEDKGIVGEEFPESEKAKHRHKYKQKDGHPSRNKRPQKQKDIELGQMQEPSKLVKKYDEPMDSDDTKDMEEDEDDKNKEKEENSKGETSGREAEKDNREIIHKKTHKSSKEREVKPEARRKEKIRNEDFDNTDFNNDDESRRREKTKLHNIHRQGEDAKKNTGGEFDSGKNRHGDFDSKTGDHHQNYGNKHSGNDEDKDIDTNEEEKDTSKNEMDDYSDKEVEDKNEQMDNANENEYSDKKKELDEMKDDNEMEEGDIMKSNDVKQETDDTDEMRNQKKNNKQNRKVHLYNEKFNDKENSDIRSYKQSKVDEESRGRDNNGKDGKKSRKENIGGSKNDDGDSKKGQRQNDQKHLNKMDRAKHTQKYDGGSEERSKDSWKQNEDEHEEKSEFERKSGGDENEEETYHFGGENKLKEQKKGKMDENDEDRSYNDNSRRDDHRRPGTDRDKEDDFDTSEDNRDRSGHTNGEEKASRHQEDMTNDELLPNNQEGRHNHLGKDYLHDVEKKAYRLHEAENGLKNSYNGKKEDGLYDGDIKNDHSERTEKRKNYHDKEWSEKTSIKSEHEDDKKENYEQHEEKGYEGLMNKQKYKDDHMRYDQDRLDDQGIKKIDLVENDRNNQHRNEEEFPNKHKVKEHREHLSRTMDKFGHSGDNKETEDHKLNTNGKDLNSQEREYERDHPDDRKSAHINKYGSRNEESEGNEAHGLKEMHHHSSLSKGREVYQGNDKDGGYSHHKWKDNEGPPLQKGKDSSEKEHQRHNKENFRDVVSGKQDHDGFKEYKGLSRDDEGNKVKKKQNTGNLKDFKYDQVGKVAHTDDKIDRVNHVEDNIKDDDFKDNKDDESLKENDKINHKNDISDIEDYKENGERPNSKDEKSTKNSAGNEDKSHRDKKDKQDHNGRTKNYGVEDGNKQGTDKIEDNNGDEVKEKTKKVTVQDNRYKGDQKSKLNPVKEKTNGEVAEDNNAKESRKDLNHSESHESTTENVKITSRYNTNREQHVDNAGHEKKVDRKNSDRSYKTIGFPTHKNSLYHTLKDLKGNESDDTPRPNDSEENLNGLHKSPASSKDMMGGNKNYTEKQRQSNENTEKMSDESLTDSTKYYNQHSSDWQESSNGDDIDDNAKYFNQATRVWSRNQPKKVSSDYFDKMTSDWNLKNDTRTPDSGKYFNQRTKTWVGKTESNVENDSKKFMENHQNASLGNTSHTESISHTGNNGRKIQDHLAGSDKMNEANHNATAGSQDRKAEHDKGHTFNSPQRKHVAQTYFPHMNYSGKPLPEERKSNQNKNIAETINQVHTNDSIQHLASSIKNAENNQHFDDVKILRNKYNSTTGQPNFVKKATPITKIQHSKSAEEEVKNEILKLIGQDPSATDSLRENKSLDSNKGKDGLQKTPILLNHSGLGNSRINTVNNPGTHLKGADLTGRKAISEHEAHKLKSVSTLGGQPRQNKNKVSHFPRPVNFDNRKNLLKLPQSRTKTPPKLPFKNPFKHQEQTSGLSPIKGKSVPVKPRRKQKTIIPPKQFATSKPSTPNKAAKKTVQILKNSEQVITSPKQVDVSKPIIPNQLSRRKPKIPEYSGGVMIGTSDQTKTTKNTNHIGTTSPKYFENSWANSNQGQTSVNSLFRPTVSSVQNWNDPNKFYENGWKYSDYPWQQNFGNGKVETPLAIPTISWNNMNWDSKSNEQRNTINTVGNVGTEKQNGVVSTTPPAYLNGEFPLVSDGDKMKNGEDYGKRRPGNFYGGGEDSVNPLRATTPRRKYVYDFWKQPYGDQNANKPNDNVIAVQPVVNVSSFAPRQKKVKSPSSAPSISRIKNHPNRNKVPSSTVRPLLNQEHKLTSKSTFGFTNILKQPHRNRTIPIINKVHVFARPEFSRKPIISHLNMTKPAFNKASASARPKTTQSRKSNSISGIKNPLEINKIEPLRPKTARNLTTMPKENKLLTTVPKGCFPGEIMSEMTLENGLDAGNYTNVGRTELMDTCISKCCEIKTCEVAIQMDNVCFAIKCHSKETCKIKTTLGKASHHKLCFISRRKKERQDMFDFDNILGSQDVCPKENAVGLNWKKTIAGTFDERPCPKKAKGLAKRKCSIESQWLSPDFSGCVTNDYERLYRRAKRLVYGEDMNALLQSLAMVTTRTIDNSLIFGGDLKKATEIITSVVQEQGNKQENNINNQNVKDFLVTCSNLLDDSNNQEWRNIQKKTCGSADILRDSQKFAMFASSKLLESQVNLTYVTSNILLQINHQVKGSKEITFPDYSNLETAIWDGERDNIKIPASVFSIGDTKMVSFSYRTLSELLPNSEYFRRSEPNSKILASIVEPRIQDKITPAITITLHHLKENRINPRCVFWDFNLSPTRGGAWSDKGCWLQYSDKRHSVCRCNHLSNFAVLMDVVDSEETQVTFKDQLHSREMAAMWICIPVLVVLIIGGLYTAFTWNRGPKFNHNLLNEKSSLLRSSVTTQEIRYDYSSSPSRHVYADNSPKFKELEWQNEFGNGKQPNEHETYDLSRYTNVVHDIDLDSGIESNDHDESGTLCDLSEISSTGSGIALEEYASQSASEDDLERNHFLRLQAERRVFSSTLRRSTGINDLSL